MTKIAARLALALVLGLGTYGVSPGADKAGAQFVTRLSAIDDLKAVYATVHSTDTVQARVRIAGTVSTLKVDEGSQVEAGEVIAVVIDQKLALQKQSIEAKISALESRVATASRDLARAERLKGRGVVAQARLDQLTTAFSVATNDLKSARLERSVILRRVSEGRVLAPASGRVLKVPVTVGSVVLPGENIATIAANKYRLRLELPERHTRFIKVGDAVIVGARGLARDGAGKTSPADARVGTKNDTGKIIQVYPQLDNGRVIADAEVSGLGNYFVGERVLVRISTGKRKSIIVPRNYVIKRFGQDFVRLVLAEEKGETGDIVVQLGEPARLEDGRAGVEVLAGLRPGDRLVRP